MNYKEAVTYIENYGWSSTKIGLDRTLKLLERFGNPHRKLKYVHVTGSNGKGSTCAMLASVLHESGYKTGLYTSPYIQDFCERIQVDGEKITKRRLATLTARAKEYAEAMEDHPSQFELVTAIAFQYFYEQHCDIVVLEVGMGGTWDSTNVIPAPEVAVITNIGLEHTEYLGSTLEAIAKTKSGIIKPGCDCVLYDSSEEVRNVIEKDCLEKCVPLHIADFSMIEEKSFSLDGQAFSYKGKDYEIPLLGRHQLKNAAVTIETVMALRNRGWKIPRTPLYCGLIETVWPARFEVLSEEPLFILDGGHNPQCADALASCVKDYLPGRKVVFLCGILRDKDYDAMIDSLLPYAQEFICMTPLSTRALLAADLRKVVERKGAKATACDEVPRGIRTAIRAAGTDGCVVAFGSLYLAGAVRTYIQKRKR